VRACATACAAGRACGAFAAFEYQTITSWSRARRVVGKAEMTAAGDNPRLIVTNLPAGGFKGEKDRARFAVAPARLYKEVYCARGEMENVLKPQVLDLQADRLCPHYLASNQPRLC